MRAIEHNFEVILTPQQLDIVKAVAPVTAIGLIGTQFAIAIEFCIPATGQNSAQRSHAETARPIEWPVRDERTAAISRLCRQRTAQGIDVTQRDLRCFQRAKQSSRSIIAKQFESERVGTNVRAA